MPRVRVPKIYWATTARRVLTMEWIDGASAALAMLHRPVIALRLGFGFSGASAGHVQYTMSVGACTDACSAQRAIPLPKAGVHMQFS